MVRERVGDWPEITLGQTGLTDSRIPR
jgi:hypothetical protein